MGDFSERKKVFGMIIVLMFIVFLGVMASSDKTNITGGAVVDVASGSGGFLAILIVALIAVLFIGGFDWISAKKK